jgi:gluconate 2-dehydrogenase gamma chain
MSEISRREVLGGLAAAFAASGVIDPWAAADVHAWIGQGATAPYAPKALSAQEFSTLTRLTDLIIPVDNGKPGAVEAGVPAWIDTMLGVSDVLKTRYSTGLAWMDVTMKSRNGSDFVGAASEQQTALLDLIAFKRNATPDLAPGIEFFTLVRRMTVDGFYTSPMGMRDIYQGNQGQPAFAVPDEAMAYVIGRSPLQ